MSEMWDSVAAMWERNADAINGRMAAPTALMLDAAAIDVGHSVLDLACGPGGAGRAAADRVGPSGTIVLADDAPEMLAAATRRSVGIPNVSTMLCRQEDIPMPDESFDAVICRHGLMFAEDQAAVVNEAGRVLKPGGRYAAMTFGWRAENPWLGLAFDAVGEEFGVPFPPPSVLGPFSLEDPDQLAEVLRDGGLEEVQVEWLAAPMQTSTLEAWWDLVPQLAGPMAVVLDRLEPEVRDSIRERALRAGRLAARETSGGITLDGSVLIASGRSL